MLQKFEIAAQPNVTILADPGPVAAKSISNICRYAAFVDSNDMDLQRRRPSLRVELRRSAVPVFQQFLEDSKSEWSHKGEPKID